MASVTLALWKFPIVQHVLAVLPKDDAPSKTRTKKGTESRTNQQSKVAAVPNVENLNTSTADDLPNLDVIRTSITSTTVVKQPGRRLNRPNVQKHSVTALTLPLPDAERAAMRSNRSVAKTETESSGKSEPKAKASDPGGTSQSSSTQTTKPKVIPWP